MNRACALMSCLSIVRPWITILRGTCQPYTAAYFRRCCRDRISLARNYAGAEPAKPSALTSISGELPCQMLHGRKCPASGSVLPPWISRAVLSDACIVFGSIKKACEDVAPTKALGLGPVTCRGDRHGKARVGYAQVSMPEERTRTVLAGCSPSRGKVRSFMLIWKRPPASRRLGYIQTGGCKPHPVSP